MPDKTIGELPRAASFDDAALLVAEQAQEAVSVSGEQIKTYAAAAAQSYATQAALSAEAATASAESAAGSAETAAAAASSAITAMIDDTLSQPGKVADAKAAGDAITKAYPTDVSAGRIANFPDGADGVPVKSLLIDIEPAQAGTGNPSPSNIRPITGWTEVKAIRTDGNIFVESLADWKNNYQISSAGAESSNTAYKYSQFYLPILPNETYSVRFTKGATTNAACHAAIYDGNKTFISRASVVAATSSTGEMTGTFTTPSNAAYIRLNLPRVSSTNVQVELGTTLSAYDASKQQIITVQIGQTVYGGTLDIATGVLTVTEIVEKISDLVWSSVTVSGHTYFRGYSAKGSSYIGNANLKKNKAECFVNAANVTSLANADHSIVYGTSYWSSAQKRIVVRADECENEGTFVSAYGQYSICYTISTPITYQLTPAEVKTLLGVNNIWSDAGDVGVTYRADTKKYIDKLTAPDNDMVADANIPSGKYFIVGNTLYLSTASIPSGSQIIPGTNCTMTNLAEALNALNA